MPFGVLTVCFVLAVVFGTAVNYERFVNVMMIEQTTMIYSANVSEEQKPRSRRFRNTGDTRFF